MPSLKRCRVCEQELPATADFFYRAPLNKDGFQNLCKNCKRAYGRQYRQNNPEKVRESARKTRQKQKGYKREYMREYRQTHFEELKAKRKEAYWRDPQKARAAAIQWKRDHQSQANERSREWRHTHKELYRQRAKVAVSRRRARKESVGHSLTEQEWAQTLKDFNNCCAVCGRPVGLWHTIAMDHWIPLKHGGETTARNVIPLCHSLNGGEDGCNNRKSAKMPLDWLVERYGEKKGKRIYERISQYLAQRNILLQR